MFDETDIIEKMCDESCIEKVKDSCKISQAKKLREFKECKVQLYSVLSIILHAVLNRTMFNSSHISVNWHPVVDILGDKRSAILHNKR